MDNESKIYTCNQNKISKLRDIDRNNEIQEIYSRIKEIGEEYAEVKGELETVLTKPRPIRKTANGKNNAPSLSLLKYIRDGIAYDYAHQKITSSTVSDVYENVSVNSLPKNMQKLILPNKFVSLAEKRLNLGNGVKVAIDILKLIAFIALSISMSSVFVPLIGTGLYWVPIGIIGFTISAVKFFTWADNAEFTFVHELILENFLESRENKLKKAKEELSKTPAFADLQLEAIDNLEKQMLVACLEEDISMNLNEMTDYQIGEELEKRQKKIIVLSLRRRELIREYKALAEKLSKENKTIPSLIPDMTEKLVQNYNSVRNLIGDEAEKLAQKYNENAETKEKGKQKRLDVKHE